MSIIMPFFIWCAVTCVAQFACLPFAILIGRRAAWSLGSVIGTAIFVYVWFIAPWIASANAAMPHGNW